MPTHAGHAGARHEGKRQPSVQLPARIERKPAL